MDVQKAFGGHILTFSIFRTTASLPREKSNVLQSANIESVHPKKSFLLLVSDVDLHHQCKSDVGVIFSATPSSSLKPLSPNWT